MSAIVEIGTSLSIGRTPSIEPLRSLESFVGLDVAGSVLAVHPDWLVADTVLSTGAGKKMLDTSTAGRRLIIQRFVDLRPIRLGVGAWQISHGLVPWYVRRPLQVLRRAAPVPRRRWLPSPRAVFAERPLSLLSVLRFSVDVRRVGRLDPTHLRDASRLVDVSRRAPLDTAYSGRGNLKTTWIARTYCSSLLFDARDVGPSAGDSGGSCWAVAGLAKARRNRLVTAIAVVLFLRLILSVTHIREYGRTRSAELAHSMTSPLGLLPGRLKPRCPQKALSNSFNTRRLPNEKGGG